MLLRGVVVIATRYLSMPPQTLMESWLFNNITDILASLKLRNEIDCRIVDLGCVSQWKGKCLHRYIWLSISSIVNTLHNVTLAVH